MHETQNAFHIIGEFYSSRAGNDKCESVKKKNDNGWALYPIIINNLCKSGEILCAHPPRPRDNLYRSARSLEDVIHWGSHFLQNDLQVGMNVQLLSNFVLTGICFFFFQRHFLRVIHCFRKKRCKERRYGRSYQNKEGQR